MLFFIQYEHGSSFSDSTDKAKPQTKQGKHGYSKTLTPKPNRGNDMKPKRLPNLTGDDNGNVFTAPKTPYADKRYLESPQDRESLERNTPASNRRSKRHLTSKHEGLHIQLHPKPKQNPMTTTQQKEKVNQSNETRAVSPKRFIIRAGHYYVRAEHPGISGFQDWTRKVESVIAAPKARNNRLSIVREYLANGMRQFRLCNGRLPEFQPIVREVDALRWLDENPFCEIVEIDASHLSNSATTTATLSPKQ